MRDDETLRVEIHQFYHIDVAGMTGRKSNSCSWSIFMIDGPRGDQERRLEIISSRKVGIDSNLDICIERAEIANKAASMAQMIGCDVISRSFRERVTTTREWDEVQ